MERNLDRRTGEYHPYPTSNKQKALEEWMDKDMKEFYMVRIRGD